MTAAMVKKGILERLAEGIVVGDGGFAYQLEKRGYVKAGPWTPEVTVEHPEAVRQLHREFLRAGSDVMQAFSFYASDGRLENRENEAAKHSSENINTAACKIAREVADEGDALVAGCVSQTKAYEDGFGKDAVQTQFRKQLDIFVENKVDFVIAEYFEFVEEAVWAVDVLNSSGLPVASTLSIGPMGDGSGVLPGDSAVQLVEAGADIVGVNCHFDPSMSLQTIRLIKAGLDAAGLKPYLMCQPVGFHTPDGTCRGIIDLPETPFALEPRILTRWDVQQYAREAYNLGVRYIGGCCGFEPYHVRAISEELEKERGKSAPASKKHGKWGEGLLQHTKPWVRARASREYWQSLKPASGRPYCPSLSCPDNLGCGLKAGDELLHQKCGRASDGAIAAAKKHKTSS